jgi:cytochrome c peroxidase
VRNSGLTAPYFHNGAYETLEEVIDFYNNGGGEGLGLIVPNQTLSSSALNLTDTEKKELIAFLKSLNDTSAITK